jgi:hypothetical protein
MRLKQFHVGKVELESEGARDRGERVSTPERLNGGETTQTVSGENARGDR